MKILRLTDAGRVTKMRRALASEIVAGQLATRTGTASQIESVKSGLETHDLLGHREPLFIRQQKIVLGSLLPRGRQVNATHNRM